MAKLIQMKQTNQIIQIIKIIKTTLLLVKRGNLLNQMRNILFLINILKKSGQ